MIALIAHDPIGDPATMTNQTFCFCGRRLESKATRHGVLLRCPEHGIQFRYIVAPDTDAATAEQDSGTPTRPNAQGRPPRMNKS